MMDGKTNEKTVGVIASLAWLAALFMSCSATMLLFAHAAFSAIGMLEWLDKPLAFIGSLVCFMVYALLVIKLPRSDF